MLLALIARPAPAPRHASIRAALPHAGAPMDRRTALGAFAAAMVPFAAQSEEVIEEEDYTPQAGLAKLTATVEQAAQLVERSDLDQLAALIRSPVMVSFLGYEPVSESTKEVLALDPKKALQNQLKLIQAFPASSRRSAVDGLSSILEQVRTIDRLCIEKRGQQNADVEPLRKCASPLPSWKTMALAGRCNSAPVPEQPAVRAPSGVRSERLGRPAASRCGVSCTLLGSHSPQNRPTIS